MVKTDELVHCEDCKNLKNASLKGSHSDSIGMYFCDSKANKVPKDGWLRKVPLTNGPKLHPWQKNANNDCGDFEPLYEK